MINAQSLERALPAVAGMIAGRTNVPVIHGQRAQTDGKVVYLPKLPALTLSYRDYVLAIAYIYHEDGHILHSDFTLEIKPGLEQAVCGVLEDIRIENLMIRSFPAAEKYLGQMVGILVEDAVTTGEGFPSFSEEATEAELLQFYMLYRLRREVLGQAAVESVLASTWESARKKFPATMMVRLDALMFEIRNCESEADALSLSREIIKMIEEEKDKQKEPPPPDENQDGDEAKGEQPDAESGQGDGSSNQGTTSKEVGENGTGDLDALLSMTDNQVIKGVGELLEGSLDEAAETAAKSGGVLSMPNVHPLPLRNGNADLGALRGSINAIRTRTMQWMASAAEDDVTHSRAGMMMDHARLFSARMGGEVFLRKEEGIDLNAAIDIVIDRSTSMSDDIQTAAKAAVTTMLAFEVPGFETQVTVFPAYGSVSGVPYDEGVAVVKRWSESPRNLAGRIAGLTTDGGTPMAEAILFSSMGLLRREETLRLTVVITDGDPNDPELTKQAIAAARAAGITVVGLGIGVDPSRVFGQRFSAQLDDISMLSGAMIKLIKSSLAK